MKVYLDHAATTPVDLTVLGEMLPYFTGKYGNPSSQHGFGQEAAKAVEKARIQVANAIGAKPAEIYFTSGGSESDNFAIKGIADAYSDKGKHIITTQIEHPAVLQSVEQLKKQGYRITYLGVGEDGRVSIDELKSSIRDDTVLISVMTANNEMGAIQPIKEIGEIAREHKIIFHTDAVQAIGSIPVNVKEMNVDLLSMSGHKFYGPKGIGAIYIRNGVKITRFMSGGEQERNKRAGTLNTPGIVGLGKAIELATENMKETSLKVSLLRDYLKERIEEEIPEIRINGGMEHRLPNNLNVSFRYVEGESILLMLDLEGISASSGSACSSGSLEPSHVLLAMGLPAELAHGSIRFTLGKETTQEEIDYTVDKLKDIIARLRAMSPLFCEHKGETHNV
ncbi:MAG: cysteine desulfurase NifS [Christensenellales bacterium]